MLAVVMLFLLTFVRVGQSAPDTWYLAYTDHQLIMFTADGEQRDLLTIDGEDERHRPYAWRIDNDTALVHVDDMESYSLYQVSPDGIARVELPEGITLDAQLQVIAYNDSYVVFNYASAGRYQAPALLVNVADASSEMLTGLVDPAIGLSADGQYVRYLSQDDAEQWTLLERDLTTGAERTVTTVRDTERFEYFSVDAQGMHWLYTQPGNGALVNPLISADGSIVDYASDNAGQTLYWSFFDQMLIGSAYICGNDFCPVVVRVGGDETYLTAPFSGLSMVPLGQPNPDSLLVLQGVFDLWLLRKDAASVSLGERSDSRILTPLEYAVSPEKHYILTISPDTDDAYIVWDLQTAQPIITLNTTAATQINYFEGGFIVIAYDTPQDTRLYRYADGAIFDLPNGEDGVYFEPLPDGSLLYSLLKENADIGARGIYRYDPVTETYTSVVEGATMLSALPLRYTDMYA